MQESINLSMTKTEAQSDGTVTKRAQLQAHQAVNN